MGEEEKKKKNSPEKTVDEEWKKHIQEEKKEDTGKQPTQKTKQEIPEASFNLFISSLATQTLINLGEMESPFNKKKELDLDQAKFTLDTLQIIKDKTKGNLTDDEMKYLDTLLYDLRMRYVEKAK
ncbi:MAG: DUF1844 domain-containing protein [Candidatus Scalinduaceae bacterium]